MESITYLKNIKVTPKKLRFLLPNIKGKSPSMALEFLMYTPKKPARLLYQAIKSAITNAKNSLKVSDDLLKFKALMVDQGNKLKRFNPGGRGTVKPYSKEFSHIKIVIVAKEKNKVKKLDPKPLPSRQAGKKQISKKVQNPK